MASNVEAILAGLATGAQPGRSSADDSGGGINKVVGITLRLVADPGNPAVVKELSDQVSAAAHKTLQEMSELGKKVQSAASQWTESVGHALSPRWQRPAGDQLSGADWIGAKLESTPAGKKLPPSGPHEPRRSGTARPERARGPSPSEKQEAAGGRGEPFEKGADDLVDFGSHLVGLAKRFAVLTAPDEKTAEERKKQFEAVENIYGVAEDSWKAAKSGSNFLRSFAGLAAEQRESHLIRSASKAGRGTGAVSAAEEGLAGATPAAGAADLSGAATIGSAVGTGALILAGGIAVHDILAVLTGKFESLTSVVSDWIATTNRNVELEKNIERQLQAQEDNREFQRQKTEATKAHDEGRERVEEARAYQTRTVRGFASSVADNAFLGLSNPFGGGTKSELELQAKAEQASRRQTEQAAYERERATAVDKYRRAQSELQTTAQLNERIKKTGSGVAALNLGPNFNKFPTPEERKARQAEIDQAEKGAVPEGFLWGLKKGWYGEYSVEVQRDKLKARERLGSLMGLAPVNPHYAEFVEKLDHLSGGVDLSGSLVMGTGSLAKPDMAKQVQQQEQLVKAATELRDLTQNRQASLLSELATMRQQIQATRERVAAAKEGVRIAQGQVNAQKAGFAISMSRSDQQNAAKILNELHAGKDVGREKLLFLAQHGVMDGQIGARVNAGLAKDLDPGFAKALKDWGIEDELGKKEKELADVTKSLQGQFADFNKTVGDTIKNVFNLGLAAQYVSQATGQHESTKANVGGYKNPTEEPGRGASAINNGFALAIQAQEEVKKATIDGLEKLNNKLSQMAQRIREAQR